MIYETDIDFILRLNIMNTLIQCRKQKELTQEQVAEMIGKKKTTVASWEQGKSLPDLTTLYHLARYYELPLEAFYEGSINLKKEE